MNFGATNKLDEDAVHVWHLDLQLGVDELENATQLLNEEERLTAAYFREARHRDRFIAGRGLLRSLLASYNDTEPAEVRFEWSANGKPSLRAQSELAPIHFNYSHSADRAVCAITRIGPIGVDLERVQAWQDLRELEQLVFTQDEISLLEQLAEEQRDREFFRLWTHKEALVKATGDGLSLAPETFGIDLAQARVVAGELEDLGWRFFDVSRSDDWPAAIAVASEDCRVVQFP